MMRQSDIQVTGGMGLALFTALASLALLGILIPSVIKLPALLVVVVFISVITGVFFFSRVEYALLVFFFLRAIIDLLWWVPASLMSLNVMELFSGAVAGLALLLFITQVRKFDQHPCFPPFVVYVSMMLIAAMRAVDFRTTAEILARYVSVFLFMFLVHEYFDTRRKRFRFILLVSVVGVVPVLVSFYHLASGQMQVYEADGLPRLLGGYVNLHNHAYMMMYFSVVGLFWFTVVRQPRLKIVAGLATLAPLICLMLTQVRNTILSLILWILLFLTLMRRHKIALVLLVVGVPLLATNALVQERIGDFFTVFTPDPLDLDRDQIGNGRWGIWRVAVEEFLSHPIGDWILGLGVGKHRVVTQPLLHWSAQIERDPHSDWLSLLFQMGPVTVLAYWALLIQVLRYALRLRRIATTRFNFAFANLMGGMVFMQFFQNSVTNGFVHRTTINWYFWGLAGVLFAEYYATRKERREAGMGVDEPDVATLAPVVWVQRRMRR